MQETPAVLPPPEPCTATGLPAGFVSPPAWAVDATNELRLIPALRSAAQTRDPYQILARSAAAFVRAQNPGYVPVPQEQYRLGNALADLAVTGRRTYCLLATPARTPADASRLVGSGAHVDLQTAPYTESELLDKIDALLVPLVSATPTQRLIGTLAALDRAFATAWAIRGPVTVQNAKRPALGWIAVSGEDDMPHRPTNLPAPPFEQYEIPVTVPGTPSHAALTLQTRFLIASGQSPVAGAVPTSIPRRQLPPNPRPSVPDGDGVLLFLHGHVSGAEEALAIIPLLHRAGLARGKSLSIISVDLPNCGYSETFSHTRVAASSATSYPSGPFDNEPIRTPVLDFIEDFVVAFVNALDAVTPIRDRFLGVFGGSLGGNLGLRLGRRSVMPVWLTAGIVSWNAASVWDPMVNDHLKSIAPGQCVANWEAPEFTDSRKNYFHEVYEKTVLPGIVPFTQPQLWYSSGWEPCKSFNIDGSRRARREVYSTNLRQWHWRVAGEQLIYSHVDRVVHRDNNTPWRYELNVVRQLLIASAEDNFAGSNIFDATRKLAGLMRTTPGTSLFLLNTGHSVHFERPAYLAEQIAEFLVPRRPTPPSRWEYQGGSATSAPAVCSWGARRLDLFARGQDNALWHRWYENSWSPWESLGAVLSSGPAAVSWGPYRIDVFAQGQDRTLWHRWFDGRWSVWESLGGVLTSAPTVSSWGPGRLDVFARGQDDALWHRWYENSWSSWESLGGVLASAPAAVSWGPNRIDVFAQGSSNDLVHRWYDNGWSGWESLGGVLTSAPAVSSWGNSRLDVFARGQDNALRHRWYDGNWSGWESLGGVFGSGVAAVSWGLNRIDVFVRGLDNAVWRIWYDQRWGA